MTANDVIKSLKKIADPARAQSLARFFKGGLGEYGYGDRFLGVATVAMQRGLARESKSLSLDEIAKLLTNPFHEVRFVALEILVMQYEEAGKLTDERKSATEKKKVCDFYLAHTSGVNNWDLVDTSAPYILGDYLLTRRQKRRILYRLARSNNLWERRISIVATQKLIAAEHYEDTLKLAQLLLNDTHDLIHKAVGWMLREMGKKSVSTLDHFLDTHAAKMPRTMLRYAVEKFSDEKRVRYLSMKQRKNTAMTSA